MRIPDRSTASMKTGLLICLAALCGSVGVHAGTTQPAINQTTFRSETLEENVTLRICLPPGYDESTRDYPVLYVLDGEFFMNQVVSAMDFLTNSGYMASLVPAYIIVGITTGDRDHDFTPTRDEQYEDMSFPTSGGAAEFHDFLTTELFSYVNGEYRSNGHEILIGWSLGGLFTTWTYLVHPDSFDRYLAISPSLWWDDGIVCSMAEKLNAERKSGNAAFTVTLGSLEKGDMKTSVKDTFLPLMSMHGRESNFRFIEVEGEGHNTSPYVALFKGIRSLHQLPTIPDSIIASDAETQEAYLLDLANNSGLHADTPSAACESLIKLAVEQGNYEVGLQIAKLYAKNLSSKSKPWLLLGEMYFRLDRHQDSVAAFKTAIEREKSQDDPDQKLLDHYQGYLKWILDQIG